MIKSATRWVAPGVVLNILVGVWAAQGLAAKRESQVLFVDPAKPQPAVRMAQPAPGAPGAHNTSTAQRPGAKPALLPGTPPAAQAGPMGAIQRAQNPGNGEHPEEDLIRAREEMQRAYQTINALNPMSPDYGKSAATTNPQASPVPVPPEVASLQKLLAQPAVQSYLKLFSNPSFQSGISRLTEHPNRMMFLYVNGGWLLVVIVGRAWRISKTDRWWHRLWVKFYWGILFLLGAFVVIPFLVFGTPYLELATGLAEYLKK